ncbi:MAG TPA: hypothetical protein V6D20_01250 [Candidatus Obscuribacterales bacterium]
MTKAELANRILTAIGVNARTSEATQEEVQGTLKMAEDWLLSNNAIGRRVGYIVSDGLPDPNEETGLPDWATLGVVYSVAELACTYFEKQYTPSMMRIAAQGMQTIANRTVELQDVQYPHRFPRGMANGSPFSNKFYRPADRIVTHNDYLTDEGDAPITTTP